MPAGTTEVAAVVGSPIRHSLSPAIFNAGFEAAGIDWTFVAFDVGLEDAPAAFAGARALGVRALSVTMPLKTALAELVDARSATAERLGAVNSVLFGSDATTGENTDGPGLLDALRAEVGFDARGTRCVVLGAGGAARAVVLALVDAGAVDIAVVNRSPGPARAAAELAGPVGRVATAADVADGDVVINATAVGMAGTPSAGGSPIDDGLLHARQLVVDLVYHPRRTPLLAAAAARGATTVGGLGMLVHQAARQFEWWTGEAPPLDAMRAAADSAIAAR
ncbi:MAG: shikimate dehydrogenase [Acidimicrobiales bacterium]